MCANIRVNNVLEDMLIKFNFGRLFFPQRFYDLFILSNMRPLKM